MKGFDYHFRADDADLYGRVSPRAILSAIIWAAMEKYLDEGAGRDALYDGLGAVWMLSGVRTEQLAPVLPGADAVITVTESVTKGASYFRMMELSQGGALCCRGRISTLAVDSVRRSILKPDTVAPVLAGCDPGPRSAVFPRLRIRGEAEKRAEHTVRWSECDRNGHLTSARYADIVCDNCGFWAGGCALMEELQIDYNHESRPGERLALELGGSAQGGFIRGIREDGAAAFTSSYRFISR